MSAIIKFTSCGGSAVSFPLIKAAAATLTATIDKIKTIYSCIFNYLFAIFNYLNHRCCNLYTVYFNNKVWLNLKMFIHIYCCRYILFLLCVQLVFIKVSMFFVCSVIFNCWMSFDVCRVLHLNKLVEKNFMVPQWSLNFKLWNTFLKFI